MFSGLYDGARVIGSEERVKIAQRKKHNKTCAKNRKKRKRRNKK